MKTALLFCLSILFFSASAIAQPGKNLVPTATKSLAIIQLMDFGKGPIAKASLTVQSADKAVLYQGKTDKNGFWECLLPINQIYWISVGDSLDYNQLRIPNKPSSITKHTVHFNGWINGKPTVVAAPQFNMMPPSEGLAKIEMEFKGTRDQALVHEKVTFTADGSKKVFVDSTDSNGKLTMKVPLGENYTVSVAYNANFDHFDFPAHGGSYNVHVRYQYAGKQMIDDFRAGRISSLFAYDSYHGLFKEEQIKLRDAQGHKKLFKRTPTQEVAAPFKVLETQEGFELNASNQQPVMSPYYVEGLLVAGAGWGSDVLAAVDAQTGEARWSISLEESGISNIEGGEDVVVCTTESCTIYAIAAQTGQLLWSKWLANFVLSAPCIADGRVYIAYEDFVGSEVFTEIAKGRRFAMACMDLKTGEILWQQWVNGETISSAVANGDKLYFNTFSGYSYILNSHNGSILAEKQLYATCAPTIVGGQVCMSQRDADSPSARERIALFSADDLSPGRSTDYHEAPYLDAEALKKTQFAATASNISLTTGSTGVTIASVGNIGAKELVGSTSIFTQQSFQGSRPVELNGKIYFAQGNVLRCVDNKSLAWVWEWAYPTSLDDDGGAQMAPPIIANGKIVVASMDGAVREFDPLTGAILKTYTTGQKHRQQPIAAKGNYYAPSVNGKLTVLQTGNALIDKWYCWGGNAARNNRPTK